MIEQLVKQFYSDNWDAFAAQQGNRTIQENLLRTRECFTEQLWTKINDGWFHDAYIVQMHCNDADSFVIRIRKQHETIDLRFSFVVSLTCHGAILNRAASFPYSGHDKPIAQILDVWTELSENMLMMILLDNERYLRIVCSPSQQIYI